MQLLWRLQSIFAEEAICITFLIFRISVGAEESRQATDNFIVVMNHVPEHSNCDLWVWGIFKVHDFVDKTCSCKGGGRGKAEGHLDKVEWLRAGPEVFKKQWGIFLFSTFI